MDELKAIIEQMDFLLGYETRYKINRKGEVWSIKQQKFMKTYPSEDGYLKISLVKENETDLMRHKCFLHRLLALQYMPNPDSLPEIDHIDRQKQNNELSNLRWCTRIENANNKTTNIANLTEKEQEERKEALRKYQAEWAMKKRREEGVPERTKFETDEERKEAERLSKLKSTRKYRENMSAEKKEAQLEERRKKQHTEEAKEKNREYLNTPEVKERRRLQQIAKRALKTPEQLAKEAERRKELYQAKKAKSGL
jgi:hypothetical protein